VPSGRVLDHDQVIGLDLRASQFDDRRGAIGQKPLLEGRVGPGPGDDARTVLGADLLAEDLNPAIDGGAVHETFLDQQALQRLHAERSIGGKMRMEMFLKRNDPPCISGYRHIAFPHSFFNSCSPCSYHRRDEWASVCSASPS
jgi:hypothetical protein